MNCARAVLIAAVIASWTVQATFPAPLQAPFQAPPATFDNSLFIAPLYVRYLQHSDDQFAEQATILRERIGQAPYVKVGFSVFLNPQFADADLNRPLTEADMRDALADIDTIVDRARKNGLPVHISVMSGFFHGANKLRARAALEDVRNVEWFADGSIAAPDDLRGAVAPPDSIWATPSRRALLLRRRAEEGIRIIGRRLAMRMRENPETLLSVSGDGEVELQQAAWAPDLLADYSPFMIEEFRDWLRDTRYRGDLSPGSDDNHDRRTLNKDFKQSFKTWKLKYFDASGPIPFEEYIRFDQKLPRSGRYLINGGFDAPRMEDPRSAFWQAWMDFRKDAIASWEKDFAAWITAPEGAGGLSIPPDRFFSHQIPAEFLFGARDIARLKSSASPTETAFIGSLGSTGVTTFNIYNGKTYSKTATPALYEFVTRAGSSWAILEYNPAVLSTPDMPPTSDVNDLLNEMLELYRYRPHIIAPALWSDYPEHQTMIVQDSPFERALHKFVSAVGQSPWAPLR
ncbi:MAG TPA: hypothetical protein VFY29_03365 [Terriglobia bacterium]|nr:hypothetical protein [Terriglobia bacterium]